MIVRSVHSTVSITVENMICKDGIFKLIGVMEERKEEE